MIQDQFLKQLGANVKKERMKKKMSLQHLSHLTMFDASNIANIEKGRKNPHILTLAKIADCLQVEVKDFL